MREYSKVSESLWQSKRFAPLSDELKLLYLYLVTCPHGNSIGCFRLPTGYIVADLGWDLDTCQKRVSQLSDTGLIRVYEGENLIQIDKFLHHNPICNGKHASGAARIALTLPASELKSFVISELLEQKNLPSEEIRQELETSLIPVSDGYSTETETETETETKPRPNPPNGAGVDHSKSDQATSSVPKKEIFDEGDEADFWELVDKLGKKGITRSRAGQLAKLLEGDFVEALATLQEVAKAEEPSKYLGAIIRNRKAEQRPLALSDPNVPAWVNDARAQGFAVDREGERWRMSGALYNDEGEQVGC